jgi:hypothetical protein
MAPHQSNNTILDSFFGSKRDLLCSSGGGFAGVDPQQYQCDQYQWRGAVPSMPPMPSMPSCSQENIGDFRNQQNYLSKKLPNVPNFPSCTPENQYLTPKKSKKNRRVSFIMQEFVREIPSRREYTPEEIGTLYLSRKEMNASHEECWRLVDLMNSGIEYEDHEGFSKRGLIDLKDDSVDRRRKMRDQTYQIVFGVQQFHKTNRTACMDVNEITASLYHKAAAQAREEAVEAAWFDAVAVRM